jgi:predicted dehydrogenase
MDRLHAPSAIRALGLGYHMLLEKPMATTLGECVAIEAAAREGGRIVGVCHSQRLHNVYAEVKARLDAGAIGELVTFEHLEGLDPLHQAHLYVRGNWANEGRSTFMLMSKSCHDVDLMAYLVGRDCLRVASFGSLSYFLRSRAPAGAPARCAEGCPAEGDCPFHAGRIYLPADSPWAWSAGLTPAMAPAERAAALAAGPYGRCVFRADNDAVDHQVVAFEFEGGVTGTFTMTAFAPHGRRTRLHGTRGMIEASLITNTIELTRFADGAATRVTLAREAGSHGGADNRLMRSFVEALRAGDPSRLLTDARESLRSHTMVFAAERSRREGRIVEVGELLGGGREAPGARTGGSARSEP